MTHVVLESCIRCKYTDCVDVCPVDCFREGPNMLVIDPDECIDCAVCIPECPVNAILPEEDVPQDQLKFIPINADLAKKWIQYITSAKGQAKSAQMAAYPALIPNAKGWEVLQTENPDEAKRQGMTKDAGNAMDMIRAGRIKYRQWPVQQDLETWNDFWSEYKGS